MEKDLIITYVWITSKICGKEKLLRRDLNITCPYPVQLLRSPV